MGKLPGYIKLSDFDQIEGTWTYKMRINQRHPGWWLLLARLAAGMCICWAARKLRIVK